MALHNGLCCLWGWLIQQLSSTANHHPGYVDNKATRSTSRQDPFFVYKSNSQDFISHYSIVIFTQIWACCLHTITAKFVLGFVTLVGVALIAIVWVLAEFHRHLSLLWIISFHWRFRVLSFFTQIPVSPQWLTNSSRAMSRRWRGRGSIVGMRKWRRKKEVEIE